VGKTRTRGRRVRRVHVLLTATALLILSAAEDGGVLAAASVPAVSSAPAALTTSRAVRVLYTINGTPQYILARSRAKTDVVLLPPAPARPGARYGTAALSACLDAVLLSRYVSLPPSDPTHG
jgi:hypothetical protein